MAPIRRAVTIAALALTSIACSGGNPEPAAGTFDLPTSKASGGRPTTPATVPAGRLRAPTAARMFAGTKSVVGQLTRYCKGSCTEAAAAKLDFLSAPTGAFVLFTLGESPLEAIAEVRGRSTEKPGVVTLSPSSLMVFNHGLGQGRYLVDLLVRWRTSEARWRFGLEVI